MFTGKFFKKRERETLEEEARKLQAHGEYAKAAENYAKVAAALLDDNPLIYAGSCHESLRMWIKAKEPGKAMEQANAMLHVLDDTGWIKDSMEEVLNLKQIIDELKAGGYTDEAETFARELNGKLEEFGLMLKPASKGPVVSICPECGAPLPHPTLGEEIKCSFCGYVVSAS